MADAIEQTIGWMHDLHRSVGEQIFGLGNKLSSWLLLGNAGSLVLLFNAKLGRDFLAAQDAKCMAIAFCVGLFAAFMGGVATIVVSAIGHAYLSRAVNLVHDLSISQHFIDKLEQDGIAVPMDSPLNQKIAQAGSQYPLLQAKVAKLWWGIGLATVLYAVSAIAFAIGATVPIF